MTKFVRWAGLLPTMTIGQGCSWEVTTNDEIGDATIKVSVMLLIMMIMMIMMMMMMVMLVMMLEMLVMAVVTVCYTFTHSLGHTVTRSYGHWVTHSVTHSFVHSLIRSLTTHSYIPSFMHSVMSTADHQCEDSALGVTNIAACSQVTWSMSPVSSEWSTPSVIDPLATPWRVRRWRQCMLIECEWLYRGVLSDDMVDVPDVISVVDA